jgi:hypothetical protein
MGFLKNESELKETKDLIVDLSEKESAQLKTIIVQADKKGLSLVGSDLLAYFEQAPKIDLKHALKGIKSRSKAETVAQLDQETKDRLIHFMEGYDEKGFHLMDSDLEKYFAQGPKIEIDEALKTMDISGKRLYNSGFSHFAHKIPTWIFILFTLFITVVTIRKNLSLIPLLGLLSCLYMMSQIELRNWIAFVIWLCVGLIIYFVYSRKNSKLGQKTA